MPKEIINQCEQRMQKTRKILQQFVLVRLIQVF